MEEQSKSILVEDHLIVEVGSNVSVPEGANVIDLTDCQVTPGMIDAHMHMDYFDWHTVREEVYTQSEEAKTLAIARCAEKALRRGFTTVRHVGGITSNGYGVLDVKRAIEKGYFPGSRIVAAPMFPVFCRQPRGSQPGLCEKSAVIPEASAGATDSGCRKGLFCQCSTGTGKIRL